MFVQVLQPEKQRFIRNYEIFHQGRLTPHRMAQLRPCFISQHHRQYHEPYWCDVS